MPHRYLVVYFHADCLQPVIEFDIASAKFTVKQKLLKKRRRLVGVVTPHSAGTLAFGTCHAEGIVLDKYFFGDRSESVASHFASFKIRRASQLLGGTKVPTNLAIVNC